MNHPQARCRDYLLGLPEAWPPPALRDRVLAQLQARGPAPAARAAAPVARRARRWPLALAATVGTAALALALALGPLRQGGGPAAGPSSPMLAAQALEQRVLARGQAGFPAPRGALEDIDRALGDAYRRQAADEELDALWRARILALDAMDKGLAAAPVLPARI